MEKLKELLKSYNLSTNGKKEHLKSRLETFAHDQDAWKASVIGQLHLRGKIRLTIPCSIYAPVRSRVRGGGCKKNKTQSAITKRIVELFGERDVQKEFRTRKGSNRHALSVTSMPSGKLQHNDKWADDVLTSFAFSAPMFACGTDVAEPQEESSLPNWMPASSTSGPSANPQVHTDSIPGSRMDGQLQDMVRSNTVLSLWVTS